MLGGHKAATGEYAAIHLPQRLLWGLRLMRSRKRAIAWLAATALVALGLPAVFQGTATAAQPRPNHTTLVPTVPRTDTARITNGEIWDIEVVGSRVYVAGTFTSIANPGAAAVARTSLAAYDINTGRVDTTFNPVFGGGGVIAVEASPDGTALYVAGTFNTVNGVTKRKVARISPTTGAPVTTFTANADARATALAVSNTTVYVGGQFTMINGVGRRALAAVNRSTGVLDTGFNQQLTGGLGPNGLLTVQELVLSHDDAKLLVVHTGRQIGGQDRYGVGLINTATKALLPWRTRLWDDNLGFVGGIQRVYAGDISPDDSYFVVTSGSGGDRPPINDTAIAFSMNGGDNIQPLWVSRHFDSVYSVAITERAVYVGGHFSWQESPTSNVPWPGLDNVGYGTGQGLSGYGLGDQVVRRDHLGALDPVTGTAVEWNPGSDSYEGVKALHATAQGLFVGGDGIYQGGYNVGRVGFFDLRRAPAASAVDTTIVAPIEGAVKPAGEQFTISGRALAPAGVTGVALEIQQVRGAKLYLQDNLTTWGAFNTIATSVAAVNATATDWSAPVSLPAGEYVLRAKTSGRNSTSDPTKAVKKIETFRFDDMAPTTSINAPSGGLLATTTFVASGRATDDHGVNGMSYWFRNNLTGQYLQDDGSVSPAYNSFRGDPDTIGAASTTWQYEVTLPEGQWKMSASAIDNAGQTDLRGDTRDWTISATGVPPTVTIATPVAMTPPTAAAPITVEPGQRITFSGTATDEDRLRTVEVSLRNNTTRESLAADGTWSASSVSAFYRISPVDINAPTYNWSYTSVPLTPGIYDFRVRATDNLELSTSGSNQGRLSITAQVPGDAFPNGLLGFTGTDQNINALHLDLAGTATDDIGVQSVKVALYDNDTGRYVQPNGTMAAAFATVDATLASPGATSTSFTLPIDLPTKGEFSVTAWAFDTSGQQDTSTSGATARYLVYPGDADPTLDPALTLPADGTVFTDSRIVVSGRAIDDVGMGRVDVQIVNSAGLSMNSSGVFSTGTRWIQAFLTSPGTPGSNYAYTSPAIPAGTYQVHVRATDNYGQVQQTPRVVTVTVGP